MPQLDIYTYTTQIYFITLIFFIGFFFFYKILYSFFFKNELISIHLHYYRQLQIHFVVQNKLIKYTTLQPLHYLNQLYLFLLK